MRPISGPYRTLLGAAGYNEHFRVLVENYAGAMVDFSTLSGIDWFDSAKWRDSIDAPTMDGSIAFQREVGALSLSPLMLTSALNAGGSAIDGGRRIQILSAVVAPGVAPVGGDWFEVFQGMLANPEFGGRDSGLVSCVIRDTGAWLMQAWTQETKTYGTDAGQPYETVLQSILNDNINPKLGAVTLYTPVSPATNRHTFSLGQKPVLQALRDIAAQIGWDVKYRYDAAGVFRLTFFEPDRGKTVPDATFGPGEYFDITALNLPTDDVRNIVWVSYIDRASGNLVISKASDAASIAAFGPGFLQFSEDATSNIDTAGEADAMRDAALSDLKLPYATQQAAHSFFWPAQTGDLYRYQSNAVTNDGDLDLAVVEINHSIQKGSGDTTFMCRAQVAGAYKAWLLKQGSGIGTPSITDPNDITLLGFKEINRDDVSITYGFTPSPLTAQVWIYQRVLDQPAAGGFYPIPPWPTSSDTPTERFDNTITQYRIVYPPKGKLTFTFFEPRAADLTAGAVKRVTTTPVGEPPHFEAITQSLAATALFTALSVNIVDSKKLGGLLTVWVNRANGNNADPTTVPDGTFAVASTPATVDGFSTFDTPTGTFQLFSNIPVHPGRGKRIYLEFTNSDGVSSGVESITLLTNGGILDANGELLPGSIKNALQFAVDVQPVQVYATVGSFPAAADGTFAFATATGKIYRRISGAWVKDVDGADIIAASIVVGKLAAGAVNATAIAAGAVQAYHISVASLAAINPDLGIILAGKLTSVTGMVYMDLNATGTNAVIYSPYFRVNADGTAVFAGEVSSGSFTTGFATFAGGMDVFYAVRAGNGFYAPSGYGFEWPTISQSITAGAGGIFYASNASGHQFSGGTVSVPSLAIAANAVSFGAANSGGAGFRQVLVPN